MQFLSVYGLIGTPIFQQCAEAAEYVNAKYSDLYNVVVNYETPVDFYTRRRRLAADCKLADPAGAAAGSGIAGHANVAAASAGEEADIGSMSVVVVDEKSGTAQSGEAFIRSLAQSTRYRPDTTLGVYEERAARAYATFLRDRGHRYCWMDVTRDGAPLGRITFELFSKLAPHTCQNFWRLCRGDVGEAAGGGGVQLTYRGTTFFRILADAWVMGGDVSPGHGGNGGSSVYGRFFPDESFAVPHDAPGVLGMCNDGAHSNASSFYITRKPMSWMNGKYVAFGRVIEGLEVVDAIHATEVRHNQSPKAEILIANCGVVEGTA